MKNKLAFCKLCMLALFFVCGARTGYSSDPGNKGTTLTIKENTYHKLVLVNLLSLQDLHTIKVNTAKGLFSEFIIPEYGASNSIGNPKLPVMKKLLEVPVGATAKINISQSAYIDISLNDLGALFPIMPSQPSLSKSEDPTKADFKYNKATYELNQFLPHELATLTVMGTMRGTRLGRLEIAPVYYNPVKKTLRIYTSLEIEIVFENADIAATIQQKENSFSPYFAPSYGKIFNYKPLTNKANSTKYPVKYVIVADTMFYSSLQPFVEWKTKKGFTVIQAYTNNPAVGNTTTSIKSYLQNLYNAGTSANPAPSFVLLVGDVAQVPSFAGTEGSHVSDLYYCEYSGDFLPEVYYGRFSATNNSELNPQIAKTLEYEQFLMPTSSFLDTCVLIAGQDNTFGPTHGDAQVNYGTDTYFNAAHGLYSHTYPFAISGSSAAQIIQNVSKGVCMANYTAHGGSDGWSSPSFNITDINSLNNNHKYPLMIGNCCVTNTFDNPLCFGEALLRADGKGALGYIGGSNNTYWDEDFYWGVGYRNFGSGNPPLHATYTAANPGAYDATFHDHGEAFADWYTTQGQMITAGNLAVTQSGNSLYSYYWEIYHLMGDPSLMVYYSDPPEMTVTYNALMPLGVNSFDITTNAPFAYAAISKDGVLYGAALADSLGNITVNLDPITVPGVANVVITCQNKQPHIGTVVVASPAGPYVLYTKNHVNNSGTGDTLVDNNENVVLDVTLKNFGGASAAGVNAMISTTDPYISITDNTQTWGTITSNSSAIQSQAYAFTTTNYVPDQHTAPFNISIQDNSSNTWNSVFNIKINAPELVIGDFFINDSLGDNDHMLDSSENVRIEILSSNIGHSNALATTGTLTTPDTDVITINNNVFNFNTLDKGATSKAMFDITVSPTLPDTAIIDFVYTLQCGPYIKIGYYSINVGQAMEDFETGDFSKFEWQSGGNVPWTITNVLPYEGIYCAKSGTISDNQTSQLIVTMNVSTDDTISFWKKVSCEQSSWSTYWYDYLEFNMDNYAIERWDGIEPQFTKVSYPVLSGTHTFKWIFNKDVSVGEGEDCAWLDYIIFPPTIKITGVQENNSAQQLFTCYPNPSNGFTTINFDVNKSSEVSLKLFDMSGRLTDVILNDKFKQEGNYTILVNTSKYQAGIYNFELTSGNHKFNQKLIIIK